jgi:phosphoglycolate phosphatase-like HAD superfamily hydrolase
MSRPLLDFTKRHEFLVGIDSDGCAFDTMELKHKECFIPNTINYYNLQGISKYARVNLYSKSRGINRFPALVESLEWLARRPEVRERGYDIRVPAGLARWIKAETKLANPALAKAVESTGDEDLRQALEWSQAVNASITNMVRAVPPFPFVRECLTALRKTSDMLVVSATPGEALEREWEEHDIARFVDAICGQETGTKQESLSVAAQYPADRTLMIGDAPGDYAAAKANRALFFPINPGAEEASWRRLFEEGIERFRGGTFAGDYQAELLAEFDRCLPAQPSWPLVE